MQKGNVIATHDFGGQFSVNRTLSKITKDFWFKAIRRHFKQNVKMRLDCLFHKRPVGKQPGMLHPIPPGHRPFHLHTLIIFWVYLKHLHLSIGTN